MPRFLIAALLVVRAAAVLACNQSALVGDWRGAYVRGGAAQIITLHVAPASDGLVASYSVPDLGVEESKASVFDCDGDVVHLKAIYGPFTLHLDADGAEMTGQNSRWNPVMTLHLRKALVPIQAKYRRQPLDFNNGAVRLHGELFLPQSGGPFRALVLVHGSGAQGVADDFYRWWAEFLVQFNVAVLAYDKRGVGASTGDFRAASFDVLAGDVIAAVGALRRQPGIVHDDIGLVGLSQGGWVAPLAATRTRVSRLLLISAPSVTVEQQEIDRVEATLRADGTPESDIGKAIEWTRTMFGAVHDPSRWAELRRLSDADRSAPWFATVAEPKTPAELAEWKPIVDFDPECSLSRISAPVLAVYGEGDTLVPPAKNAERIRALLTRGGARVEVAVVPAANHSLETFGKLKGAEWNWPDAHWVFPRKAPQLYELVRSWLAP